MTKKSEGRSKKDKTLLRRVRGCEGIDEREGAQSDE